ncbi:hypothetical protein BCR36DRAFT_139365 [Piromyces finnis]|uniref:Right handed beta helix domain-containing protein n=1 Tax=Piromyces finnis TaxID=1754191 RepID=A0A1Y1VJQ8_9FUNG|nr:hypothetical protein BCR36DRAFT_139365 [Piromyces finnis]|eukprot:ORX57941.1 hypothetical protein BCR36DRAFT_139365 [Piromyces finnis]
MSVDRFYSRDEGALIKSYNPRTRGARIFINTFNIKNIVQESEQYTASIISSNSGSAIINGLYASNIQGIKSGLIFLEGIASVNMMNSTISNLKTVFAEPILNIRTNGTTAATTSLKLKNFILRDVYENGVLIFTNAGGIEIVDSEFHNIHECNKYNKCNPIDPELKMYSFLFENAIIYGSENVYLSSFNFTNNIFSDIYGMVGMEIPAGDVAMINNTITNSYFKNGFLYYTNYKFLHGTHNYSRLKFINNRSEKGTFINFNDVYGKGVTPTITCIQCSFVNNTAEKFGGIIYANARDEQYIDTIINFKNCEFIDNNAMLGKYNR